MLKREVSLALDETHRAMVALAQRTVGEQGARRLQANAPLVLTCEELMSRANANGFGEVPEANGDARAATRARLRHFAAATGVRGPAAVLHMLPPFHPHALPGDGPLCRAVSAVLERAPGVSVESFYPFITDASYVAWRSDSYHDVARNFPALGREYRLPLEAMQALDLDVVNLGPWGRDPHGVHERVHMPYAFEQLPVWLERIIRETWRIA